MLESFRKGQRWLTLLFVLLVGGVFIFFFGSGGGGIGPSGPTGNALVQLGETQLMRRDYNRVRRQLESQFREQLGENYDKLGADRIVDTRALEQMVNGVVLAAAARDMGLHVTTDEVRRVVQTIPGFIDAEGKFSPAAFNNFAQSQYGTQRNFIRTFTQDLLGRKLIGLLSAQTTISDAEIDLATRFELDEARITYAAIDTTALPDAIALSDDEVEAWAEENEDALRATFNERAESLATPEQVRARHILIQIPQGVASEEVENARSRAEAARSRIELGEDFATVAGEVSDDIGSKSLGGDLGFFARGNNDPAIDNAAFSLEPGALSEVIRSDYGFHLIQVEEKQEAKIARWADSRLVLAREGAEADRARTAAEERAANLATLIESGRSLEEAAGELDLSLERPPALRRRSDGFIPGLGAAPELLTSAFTLPEGTSSPQIFEVADRRVLVQVLERTEADDERVAILRDQRRDSALAQKQNAVIEAWLADYRRQLEDDGRLKINAELALGG